MKFAILMAIHPLNEQGDSERLRMFRNTLSSFSRQTYDDWMLFMAGRRGPWVSVVESELAGECLILDYHDGPPKTPDKVKKIKACASAVAAQGYNPDWIFKFDDDDWMSTEFLRLFVEGGYAARPEPGGWMDFKRLFYDVETDQWIRAKTNGMLAPNPTLLRVSCLNQIHRPHKHFLQIGDPVELYPGPSHTFCRVLHPGSWSGITLNDRFHMESCTDRHPLDGPPLGFQEC